MARDVNDIAKTVQELVSRNADRDGRFRNINAVRAGDINQLIPDGLPQGLDHSFVANIIETAARDLAELAAPLPSVNADDGRTSDRGKQASSKRTKIANYYLSHSRLQIHMFSGADRYFSYGALPFVIEPDFKAACPTIRVDNPVGAYWDSDMFGRTRWYARRWVEPAKALAAKFPLYAERILYRDNMGYVQLGDNTPLEVIKYTDDEQTVLYLPDKKNLVLMQAENPLGECPVVIAERPSLDEQIRGQFDEALWIHVARVRMALYIMEATKKNVQAPTVVPGDVNKISFGSEAIIRTNSDQKAYRLETSLPNAAMALSEQLEQGIRDGTRYPESRSGNMDASIVTGQGVQALMGGFDTQLKAAQTFLGDGIERAIQMCYRMDEKYWPEEQKKIEGTANGKAYSESYTPSKDIAGKHTVDVVYGFAAGMDPARALVFLLQLRGDQLVPRDFVQRQLPMDLDVDQLRQQIDIEQIEDGLKQGVLGGLSQIAIMAQQGVDPVQFIRQAATMIDERRRGTPLDQAILKAFQPPKQEAQPPIPGTAEQVGQDQQLPGGGSPYELPPGVAPGQAGQGPGGRPDIQTLLAGLTGAGQPQLTAGVRRQIPA